MTLVRNSERLDLRPAMTSYVAVMLPWTALLLIVGGIAIYSGFSGGSLEFLVVIFLVWCCFFTWLQRFNLSIRDGRIIYRTLFGGSQQVDIGTVKSAKMEFGPVRYPDRFRAPFRLVVEGSDAGEALIINIKIFARGDIERFADFLRKSGIEVK